jgi:serine protein kinase
MQYLLKKYNGDWKQVVDNHIRVIRKTYSEADRTGIATFQPKDEKNQDATELTGDINFSKISQFGSDSDPRAFSFDGELCVGNRGVCEFIEMLKLEQAFLYDLLGASQEKSIKPKKFSQVTVDEAIIGHTNQPEFEKLKNNQFMEALRDRTVKIDVPYLLRWNDEIKVLQQDYGNGRVKQHVAPHTLEIAALWSVLTRLQDDKDGKISLVDKAELYNGKMLAGWTEDSVKELRDKYYDEGMAGGVSARYVQDKISNCLADRHDYINPFMVLNALKDGLENNSLISNKDQILRYNTCIELASKKLDEILKSEVQKALIGDEDAVVRLCTNYIDNLMAYINKSKVKNPYTGREESPDERFMRGIETKIDVPEVGVDDFRRMVAAFIGELSHKGKQFRWDSNPLLKKAFEAKLFEDTKDHIKLSALHVSGASVVDPKIQEKIDQVKTRLIKEHGYNEQSARDVLDYVGSIFARGDLADQD